MTNPMYAVVANFNQAVNLPFELKSGQFEDTGTPFFVIALPLAKNQKITLAKKNLNIINHHFTISQEIKNNTNINSAYHYTMVLQDPKNPHLEYKLRFYFDHQDRITIEPKLQEIDPTAANNNASSSSEPSTKKPVYFPISQEELDTATALAMPHMVQYITAFKEKQNARFKELKKAVLKNEVKISLLSKDVHQNREAYFDFMDTQIDLIQKMIDIGFYHFGSMLTWYKIIRVNLGNSLSNQKTDGTGNNSKNTHAGNGHEPQNTAAPRHALADKSDSVMAVVTASQREKPIQNVASKSEKPQSIIAQLKNVLERYEQCVASAVNEDADNNNNSNALNQAERSKADLVKEMIQLYAHCLHASEGNECEDPVALSQMLVQMKLKINQFFTQSKELLLVKSSFLAACDAQITSVNDKFIKEVILANDTKTLIELVEKNLVSETERYSLSEKKPELVYSLIEWCACFEQYQCVKALLEQGYSFNYMKDSHSPIAKIAMDRVKLTELFAVINNRGIENHVTSCVNIALNMAEEEMRLLPSNDPKKELQAIRIELMRTNLAIFKITNSKPYLKGGVVVTAKTTRALSSAEGFIAFQEACDQDIVFQRQLLDLSRTFLELLAIIKDNQLMLLKKPEFSAGSVDFTHIPIDKVKSAIQRMISNKIRVFECYSVILSHKNMLVVVDKAGRLNINAKSKKHLGEAQNLFRELQSFEVESKLIFQEVETLVAASDPAMKALNQLRDLLSSGLEGRDILSNMSNLRKFTGVDKKSFTFGDFMDSLQADLQDLKLLDNASSEKEAMVEPSDEEQRARSFSDALKQEVACGNMLSYYQYFSGVPQTDAEVDLSCQATSSVDLMSKKYD